MAGTPCHDRKQRRAPNHLLRGPALSRRGRPACHERPTCAMSLLVQAGVTSGSNRVITRLKPMSLGIVAESTVASMGVVYEVGGLMGVAA